MVAYDYLGRKLPPPAELSLPLDRKGNLMIPWAGKWVETFRHYSYVELLRSYEAASHQRPTLIRPEAFRDKIVLVSITHATGADIKPTPLEPAYPGTGVLANVVNGVLTNQLIIPASLSLNALCLGVLGLMALFLLIPFRTVLSPVGGLGLCFAWFLVAFFLFSAKGLWLYVAHPLLLIFSLFAFSAVWAKLIGDEELKVLFRLSTRDSLTGVYVRRYFKNELGKGIARARSRNEPLSLILIDIDHFKRINDTHGHQIGDMVLRGVARTVQSCIRENRMEKETDVVARYGGEEFIVMLRNSTLTHAAFGIAERVRKSVEGAETPWRHRKIPVTISLGVSSLRPGDSPKELIRRADEALYRAKNGGRNQTCVEENLE
jgi:diguanylate cyclase (GGDEF)-like protein